MRIPNSWEQWTKTLVAGSISGAANAILGTAGAAIVGKPLDWKQISVVAASGGFFSAVTYLAKSPLPISIETVTTTASSTITKETQQK